MADSSGKSRYENMKTRRVRIENLQNKTNLYRRAGSIIYFVIVPPWMKKNRLRIGTAVFHFVIKKVQLVRMAKKLDFCLPTDQPARDQWLYAIRRDTGKHFTITDATKVCSQCFKKEHLKKSLGIGRLSYVDGQFHPFSHGRGAHLERESRQQSELPLRFLKKIALSKLDHRST